MDQTRKGGSGFGVHHKFGPLPGLICHPAHPFNQPAPHPFPLLPSLLFNPLPHLPCVWTYLFQKVIVDLLQPPHYQTYCTHWCRLLCHSYKASSTSTMLNMEEWNGACWKLVRDCPAQGATDWSGEPLQLEQAS